ncbi:MAG: FecR domain-containing protein [Candidatus Rifleibacteriota bacterium]
MRIKNLKIFINFLIIFVIAIIVSGCGNASKEIAAKIIKINGSVEIKHASQNTFVEAREGKILTGGSILKTGDESFATLGIVDKGLVEIKENASFELVAGKDYVVQKAGTGIYKIDKNKEGFKVKSPQGVTCVLGTVYMLKVLEGATVLGVEEGKVSFATNDGEERILKAKEKAVIDSSGFVGEPTVFDLSSDSFNYLKINGKWVPKEVIDGR